MPEASWLRLMLTAGSIGSAALRQLMQVYGDVSDVFEAGRRRCASVIGEEASRRLFSDETQARADAVLVWLQETPGADVVTWVDPDFPREAMAFPGAPSLFLLRGRRSVLRARRVALVGADRPDDEGVRNAADFAAALVRAGRSVVTFLESAADAAACRAALAVGGDAQAGVLVLSATGPDRLYPPTQRELFHRVAQQGLILTPFPPGVGVSEQTLEERRVLCAYLCSELLVVQSELGARAHALARIFAENSRDVFAVPGSIHSALYKGCHKLLREGAHLTETVTDVTMFGSETV